MFINTENIKTDDIAILNKVIAKGGKSDGSTLGVPVFKFKYFSELGDTLYLFEPMSKYDENKIRKIDKDIASLVGLLKENECVMIYGNGFDFLKTSPNVLFLILTAPNGASASIKIG